MLDNEAHLQKIQEALGESEGKVKSMMETRDDEIKSTGEAGAKTAKVLDEQVAAWESLKSDLSEVKAELEKAGGQRESIDALKAEIEESKASTLKSDELIAELQEHVKSSQRPGWGGEITDEMKSVGTLYLESEEFKAAQKNKGKGAPLFETKGSLLSATMEQKAVFLSSAAERLVEPMRRDFVDPQLRQLRIRSLLDVQTTDKDAIEYIQEVGFSADEAPPGTQTHGAAEYISEVGEVPEAKLEYVLKTEPIKDVAHFLPASKNILDDLPRLRATIDNRLLYGLGFKEDTSLLYGSGEGSELQGITTEAGVQTYLWSAGLTEPVPDTKFDAIRRSMTKAHIAEHVPDGVILHPADWEEVETVKGTDGHYLLMPIQMNPGQGMQERVWRVPVVVTNAIDAGTWLVGSFKTAAELWDRKAGTITVSDSHEDYFTHRMVAIMAEQREALVILRPAAFVNGTFDNAPAA